ncbi:MAG: radical SAM protein [Patescibacteria group bacterium]
MKEGNVLNQKNKTLYRNLSAPVSVQVEITSNCNNDCIYCYNHWRDKNQSHLTSLSVEDLKCICDQLIANQIFKVTLTGGEPLLFWQRLLVAIARLKSNKIDVNLNSNLTTITPEIAQALKNSGLESILTTVLSHKEDIHDNLSNRRGAWKQMVKGIETAMAHGLNVGVNMVLLQQNYQFLYETAQFVKSFGVRSFSATKSSPALNTRDFSKFRLSIEELRVTLEALEVVKKELKMSVDVLECYPLCLLSDLNKFWHYGRRNCTAGITTCTIGFDGNVRPCSHSDMVYDNIFEKRLSDIFSKMTDWREGRYIPDNCKNCDYFRMCSGGCRMEAKYLGDICGKDPYMTAPNDVVLKSTEIFSKISADQKFVFHGKNFRWREEEFGAIVAAEGADTLLVNKDGLNILRQLPDYPFSVADIAQKNDSKPEHLERFFAHLSHKRFITPIN